MCSLTSPRRYAGAEAASPSAKQIDRAGVGELLGSPEVLVYEEKRPGMGVQEIYKSSRSPEMPP